MHDCTAHGISHAPFSAPEWTVHDDTILARWCVGVSGANSGSSITTLVTNESGSFLVPGDALNEHSRHELFSSKDIAALTYIPQHVQPDDATLPQRADMALADVRHAVTSGDPRMLAFFVADATRSTPTLAVAAHYICDALWAKAQTLQQTAAPGSQAAALRDAAVQLRTQAAQAHVPQALNEVEDEIRARIVAVASTLCRQASQASDQETIKAYMAAAELVLQPVRTPAESAIIAARSFIDLVQRDGADEVADDAAMNSVDIRAGLIHALDDVRGTVAEVFAGLERALEPDLDVSPLHDVITNLHSAGEDVPRFLDELDPDRLHLVVEL